MLSNRFVEQVAQRDAPLSIHVLRIAFFVVVLTIAARIAIPVPGTPVPITMQTLGVLLTGMVLGPVEGALSLAAYLGLIALGLPLDAYGLGHAALFSPTAGYLIGFVPGAFIAGLAWRTNERRKLLYSLILGFLAIIVIYVFGTVGLLPLAKGSWSSAFMKAVIPFIFVDFGKVLLAAALVRLGDTAWLRWITPHFMGKS